MKTKKFLRRDSVRFSKLGKNRKKLQKWRGAKGRDNKIRLSRKGYPKAPSVGYARARDKVNKINGEYPKLVHNMKELEGLNKNEIAILAKIGSKKKLEIIKKAEELNLRILNVRGVEK